MFSFSKCSRTFSKNKFKSIKTVLNWIVITAVLIQCTIYIELSWLALKVYEQWFKDNEFRQKYLAKRFIVSCKRRPKETTLTTGTTMNYNVPLTQKFASEYTDVSEVCAKSETMCFLNENS